MSSAKRLTRFLASRAGRDIEIALATETGETIRLIATPDQIDRLVDELEDVLNSDEAAEPPAET